MTFSRAAGRSGKALSNVDTLLLPVASTGWSYLADDGVDVPAALLERQSPDGAFEARRIPLHGLASTAEALLVTGPGRLQANAAERALDYLAGYVRDDGSMPSAAGAVDLGWPGGPPAAPRFAALLPEGEGVRRTHPAAVTLLAFGVWGKHRTTESERLRSFLTRTQHGGVWGASVESVPSPAFTALAVLALTATGTSPRDLNAAAKYLRDTRRPHGWWPDVHEPWLVRSGGDDTYGGTHLDGTAICTAALRHLGGPVNRFAARQRRT